jgi:hypothetical protein
MRGASAFLTPPFPGSLPSLHVRFTAAHTLSYYDGVSEPTPQGMLRKEAGGQRWSQFGPWARRPIA